MTIVGRAEKALDEVYKNMEQLLTEREDYDKMLSYAGKYQISIQFWGNGNTNVFIEKDGVELTDFGGLMPQDAIKKTVEYLNRINKQLT
jgi:hypothetical protein